MYVLYVILYAYITFATRGDASFAAHEIGFGRCVNHVIVIYVYLHESAFK